MKKTLLFLTCALSSLTPLIAQNEETQKPQKPAYTTKALIRDSARIVGGTVLVAAAVYNESVELIFH